ncbi:MAG: hypothetical protein K2W96_06400, partial [Gemmataceae bacterium]|nr:hypothetical protein [Gemmataceae bacterium]
HAAGTFSLARPRRRFGEWLIDENLATQPDIDAALLRQASIRFSSLPPFDALAVARLLQADILPGHVGRRVGDLGLLTLPTPNPAPPLGDLLVSAGVLPAASLAPALARFLDPFWH